MMRNFYFFSISFLLSVATQVYGQCSLGNPFGGVTAPTVQGAQATISNCSFLGEYSTVQNVQAGSTYSINISSPNSTIQGFVTIYLAGTSTPVFFGPAPLVFNPVVSGTYLMQWNGPLCATQTVCMLSTISLLGPGGPTCQAPFLAGVISSNSASVCAGDMFTMSLSGGSTGSGISYQWQVSTNGGPYSDILGALSSSISVTQTQASDYRCVANCNGTLYDTTAVVSVGMNAAQNCYCISQANFIQDGDVFGVAVSNLNNTSNCSTVAPAGSILSKYSDYTSLSPALLAHGNTYPLTITTGTCGGVYFNNTLKVWIDYNQNGSFLDAGEEVFVTTTTQVGAYTANITIPLTALTGLTRMRVVNWETMNTNTVVPCGTYSWGETEDYIVQIGSSSTFGCVNGNVFCDNNGNGLMDSSDVSLISVPIVFAYNGQTQVISTSSSGNYFFGFQLDTAATSASVSLDPAWLAQNGIQASPTSLTITQLSCNASNPSFNFPVNCDSSSIQSSCMVGWVFCDSNANGIMDNYELVFANAPVVLSNGVTVYSDSTGMFSYSGGQNPSGTLTASVASYWLLQNAYTLTNNSITASTDCDSLTPVYFGLDCSGTPCSDLFTTVTPWIGYFQNQNAYVKINWGTFGPNPPTGYTLTFTYPAGVTLNTNTISNTNYTVSGNTITWTFGPQMSNFFQTDIIQFFVPSGFPSGTSHVYSSTITANGTTADCDSTNNAGSLCMILGNSYDPNDKSTSLPTIISPDVQDELTYVIRFQNTGTAPAQDVYIIDTLSPNLDWSSLKLITHSHFMQLIDLGNGVMKFNFPGIWLPDSTSNEPASHGQVVFSIKENASNLVGSAIENTGYIYFDWNPAIVTNTTFNVNAYLGIEDVKANEVSVYPNPFEAKVELISAKRMENVAILDITGKMIYNESADGFTKTLDLSSLAQGTYLVNIMAGGETSTVRIVKK